MSIAFSFDDLYTLIREMHGADAIVAEQTARMMTASLDAFQQAVQIETPVSLGALRSSVMTTVSGTPVDLEGTVTTALPYGLPVEFGRNPGKMPPPSALELWVVRKWGLSGEDAIQASWALARYIGKHGTQGAFMFQKGFDNALPSVLRLWDNLPGAVVEQV